MKPLLFPSLALLSALFSGCPDEGSETAAGGAPGATESQSSPEIPPELGKYNVNLPKKGDQLPDIAGLTLQGKAIDNAWLKGKTTLINLWFYN